MQAGQEAARHDGEKWHQSERNAGRKGLATEACVGHRRGPGLSHLCALTGLHKRTYLNSLPSPCPDPRADTFPLAFRLSFLLHLTTTTSHQLFFSLHPSKRFNSGVIAPHHNSTTSKESYNVSDYASVCHTRTDHYVVSRCAHYWSLHSNIAGSSP